MEEEKEEGEGESKGDLSTQMVETRVRLQDARLRVEENLTRLSKEFSIEWDIRGLVTSNPLKSLGIACAIGFYIGLRKG